MTNKIKLTVFAVVAIAALGTVMSIRPAQAATPNNQACFGTDISGYAHDNPAFPDFLIALAKSVPGVGSIIQMHMAGLVPDSVIPNSCNDS